ncbi:(2Fe-2S) ferredoxin domain-containing protein [Streptomonospora sp. S1-112]|uniref:(2Fe-2S) ferredoxin domain-containing protein n=1 Tax=Streptomonospora mangrovi TaxID=2883123 RepID=A0A9X3NNB0_9ACTN|nr:(2Fe-2S) ferredoxin domain-containing protein [Streptomonospora mangrovi]MDA0564924.1 (2Fe-2S) ferredoxin domain-containing protein [Streptomonospora mangrovi]
MEPAGRPCRLVVCRGCCCGTRKKVPGVDHAAQLARLRGLRDGRGRDVPVRTSTCLGICFQANVVVVQPSGEGRARGGRPVWLGEFTEDRLVDDLQEWIAEGGPGAAPLPERLAGHLTSKDAKKPKKAKKKAKDKKSKKLKKAREAEQERLRDDARPGSAAPAGTRADGTDPKATKAKKKDTKAKKKAKRDKKEDKKAKRGKKAERREKKDRR